MPAYNSEKWIDQSIQSVIDQTYQDWELLIANDRSSDNTIDVVKKWQAREPRIFLFDMPLNCGPAAARNVAMSNMSGRWLAFLDSDDLWLPEKLKLQLEFHLNLGCKLSFTGFRRFSPNLQTLGRKIEVPSRLDYHSLLRGNVIATSTVLVDLDRTSPFRMKDIYFDDFACWLGILKSGGYAYGLSDDLMRYRVLEQSISRNKFKSAMQTWVVLRKSENLPLLMSIFYFVNYAVRGFAKYLRF